MIEKTFDEYWAEEEAVLKISLEVSRRNKAERLNKAPAKELIDVIEGRRQKRKEKHMAKRKGQIDHRTNRPGKRK
jgi:hypothetical protein|tara:strand:+ start:1355 stop:1579 length:225 start_codon:yes stop_codon:yes gene_type:complete